MTARQKILKFIYPLFVAYKRIKARPKILQNKNLIQPIVSFYSLATIINDGNNFSFDKLEGKKILLVNTASDCGYTAQYKELQKLQEKFSEELQIIAFPSNDFKRQEKGSDEEIKIFCKKNYSVTFPIVKKSHVRKMNGQNEIFQWLTTKELNGWNDEQPTWNFSKYLVNEQGILTHYFDPAISPIGRHVLDALSIRQL